MHRSRLTTCQLNPHDRAHCMRSCQSILRTSDSLAKYYGRRLSDRCVEKKRFLLSLRTKWVEFSGQKRQHVTPPRAQYSPPYDPPPPGNSSTLTTRRCRCRCRCKDGYARRRYARLPRAIAADKDTNSWISGGRQSARCVLEPELLPPDM